MANLSVPLKRAFASAIAASAITLFLPDYFRSEVKILPVESKGAGSLGQLATAAAAMGFSLPNQEGNDTNALEILGSRWLRQSILNTEVTFQERSWKFGAPHIKETTVLNYLRAKNYDKGLVKLDSILWVTRDLKTKVLTISVETKSPELSQQVARRATTLLETYLVSKGKTRGGQKAAFASARLVEARAELGQSEEDLRAFLERNRNYATSAEPSVRIRGAHLEVELKLRQQLMTTLASNLEQSLLEEKNDLPILNVLDEANLPIEKSAPFRGKLVLLVFFLSGFAFWLWSQRQWIKSRFVGQNLA